MSDASITAIIVAVVAAIPGTIGAILGVRNAGAIKDVHLSLNSRLDQLLTASEDKVRIAERSEQRAAGSIPEPPTIP
jgi:hypothetical protein